MILKFAREHYRLHQLAGAKDHAAGNYKLFHSNGSGQLVELSLGAAGEVLTAMGASAAPEFAIKSSNENLIINGDFDFWQRGLNFPSVAGGGAYVSDRWRWNHVGSMVMDVGATTATRPPESSNHTSVYTLEAEVTTADAVIAADAYASLRYGIEGYDIAGSLGRTMTLSFWVKSSVTGIYSISFHNHLYTSSYVTEYTINSANTWEKKTITFVPDAVYGNWHYTDGMGMEIRFAIAFGSNFTTSTLDEWTNVSKYASTNQVNVVGTVGNKFGLAQVKFEPGSVATRFQSKIRSEEILQCQRYYHQTRSSILTVATVYNASYIRVSSLNWPTEMRTIPSVALQNVSFLPPASGFGTIGTLYSPTQRVDGMAPAYNTSGGTVGYCGMITYEFTAVAEI